MKNGFKFLLIGLMGLNALQATTAQAAGIPVPSTSKSYTVAQLLALINTNNPQKNSTFLVLSGEKSSASPNAAQAQLINANLNQSVKLSRDDARIQYLAGNNPSNHFDSDTTQTQYAQILLYFTLGGQKFYLNDPNPPAVYFRGRAKSSGAADIVKKWDLSKTF